MIKILSTRLLNDPKSELKSKQIRKYSSQKLKNLRRVRENYRNKVLYIGEKTFESPYQTAFFSPSNPIFIVLLTRGFLFFCCSCNQDRTGKMRKIIVAQPLYGIIALPPNGCASCPKCLQAPLGQVLTFTYLNAHALCSQLGYPILFCKKNFQDT